MKKGLSVICALSMFCTVLSACGSSSSSTSPSTEASTTVSAETSAPEETEKDTAGEVTTITAYISDAEYNHNIIAGFEAENPDIKVDIVPVDFDNAEQVIKTGIASGNPVDVSFFWGTQIEAFSRDGMALDLTPYLEENNNEWKDTIVPASLEGSKFDGKYWAVPYQQVIETIFYNKDLFEEYNLEVPTTWDEYMEVCEVFKQNGIYGIGNYKNINNQMIWTALHEMANNGTLELYTSGQGDFTKCTELKECLERLKDMYDKGYWYPGEGALVATQDQVQAAWYQGQIATFVDAGSNAGTYDSECDFEVGVMRLPVVREGGKYAFGVITNALFIPVNAKHPEEAVRFMKYYTSDAGIAEIIKSGRLPATVSMLDKVDSPIMQDLINTTLGDDAVGYSLLQYISSEIYAYIEDDMVGAACSGQPIDEILQELEDMRLRAVS